MTDSQHGASCVRYCCRPHRARAFCSITSIYILIVSFILGDRKYRNHIGHGWLGSRVVGVLDSGAEGPGFKSQPRRCRVTVLSKLFTPVVPLFTKQRNW